MKRISFILSFSLVVLISSCSEESSLNDQSCQTIVNTVLSTYFNESSETNKNGSIITSKTECSVLFDGMDVGRKTLNLSSGENITLEYTYDLTSDAIISWTTDSDSISLVSTNGNQATFRITGAGQILCKAEGELSCSDWVTIELCTLSL